MARFTVNATRFDRYENFKFRIFWEGSNTPVAGVSEVSALERSTEVAKYREGGDPSNGKLPGRSKCEAVTLERGVTHDTAFVEWANKAWNRGSGVAAKVSLKGFRRNVIIEMYNEAGQLALRYKVYRCWVSEFTALPDLGANANVVPIQSLKLENEGWERDYRVAELSEPSRSTSGRRGKKARVLRRRPRSR
jgi:phage tail-like protein